MPSRLNSWTTGVSYRSRIIATPKHLPVMPKQDSWTLFHVLPHAGFLRLSWHKTTLEAGYRQQMGLQKRIPDNRCGSVLLSRTF
jgi:hypothetical protein